MESKPVRSASFKDCRMVLMVGLGYRLGCDGFNGVFGGYKFMCGRLKLGCGGYKLMCVWGTWGVGVQVGM